MKKLIFIMAWYIFVNSSDPFDKWIIVYESEDVTVKVKNTDFLEYQELLQQSEERVQLAEDIKAYIHWETVEKFEKFRWN